MGQSTPPIFLQWEICTLFGWKSKSGMKHVVKFNIMTHKINEEQQHYSQSFVYCRVFILLIIDYSTKKAVLVYSRKCASEIIYFRSNPYVKQCELMCWQILLYYNFHVSLGDMTEKWRDLFLRFKVPGSNPTLIFSIALFCHFLMLFLLLLRDNGHCWWAASWQNQQNGMCAQRRLRSAWASAQSDQSLRCSHEESLGP